jgi:hypothetical protein
MRIHRLSALVSAVAVCFASDCTAASEKSTTDQIASYFPHWVSRDGNMPPRILDNLVPGTVIAAHHGWDLSQLKRILDYPGKSFKISWYAEADMRSSNDPTPVGTTVATRVNEAKRKQGQLAKKYGGNRFTNLFELDAAREKRSGNLSGRGNSRSDWVKDATAVQNAGFRFIAKSPTPAHVNELRAKFGRDFIPHIVFEDVTGSASDDNPGYASDAKRLAAKGENITLVIHSGAYGGFKATSLAEARAIVARKFNLRNVEAYWGKPNAGSGFVKLKSFASARDNENTAAVN